MQKSIGKSVNLMKTIKITNGFDVAEASSEVLRTCESAGFSHTKSYLIATAVSELGTNIHRYAREGTISVRMLADEPKNGIEIVAEDTGPGIADVNAAMKDHFSTSNSLGIGLPGVKRLMDEFELRTDQGVGTRITVRKWL